MRIGIGLLSLWGVLCASAAHAELYRYIDASGGVVLDRHGVPADLIGRGYEVLNDQGRVIRVVPPAPTPAERARQQAEQQRAELDAKLLRLYSSVEDVERARLRKLSEIDSLIAIAEGNLQALKLQREKQEKERREREEAGQSEAAAQRSQIERIASDQLMLQAQLKHYRELREQAHASFTRDSARLEVLLEANR